MIRVLIIHNNPLVRLGIRSILERDPEIQIGETTQFDEILEQVATTDVVIFDGTLVFYDSYEEYSAAEMVTCMRQVRAHGIVVLVPGVSEEDLFWFLVAGAAACEPDTLSADALVTKVRRVADGEYLITSEVLPPEADDSPGSQVQTGTLPATEPDCIPLEAERCGVTGREIEVLRCVRYGLSNKLIARHLAISDQTVKNHITSALRRLRVRDRTAAVVAVLRLGLITLDDPLPEKALPIEMSDTQNQHVTSSASKKREEVAV